LDIKNIELKKQYLTLRNEKILSKQKMQILGLMTDEQYDSWVAWELPIEIEKELPLITKLIKL
jgi:hypothetical protein